MPLRIMDGLGDEVDTNGLRPGELLELFKTHERSSQKNLHNCKAPFSSRKISKVKARANATISCTSSVAARPPLLRLPPELFLKVYRTLAKSKDQFAVLDLRQTSPFAEEVYKDNRTTIIPIALHHLFHGRSYSPLSRSYTRTFEGGEGA